VRRILDNLSCWNKDSNLDGLELTASVGVAEWEEGKTLDEVLDAADQDMYAIKNHVVKPGTAELDSK
jgi:PleD family two-component response regulator